MYSRRFTKIDHINLVTLLHSVLTIEKLDFRVVKIIANALTTLLSYNFLFYYFFLIFIFSRKNLLKRTDIVLEWRSLYNLFIEINKNMEEV